MTPGSRGADVVIDPALPLVRFTRDFDVPPTGVFRAHADPDLAVRWLGPHGSQSRLDHYTCRTGGSYRCALGGDRGESIVEGCFHEVRSAALIVATLAVDAVPDVVALLRLRFEPAGDEGTRLDVSWSFEGFEARAAVLGAGAATAMTGSYDRLDGLLVR